jgi:hypothetical protein
MLSALLNILSGVNLKGQSRRRPLQTRQCQFLSILKILLKTLYISSIIFAPPEHILHMTVRITCARGCTTKTKKKEFTPLGDETLFTFAAAIHEFLTNGVHQKTLALSLRIVWCVCSLQLTFSSSLWMLRETQFAFSTVSAG